MTRVRDILLTALAPAVWGSTYIVTTEMLPEGYPLTVAMLRALPAGLLLMLLVRTLPKREWLLRLMILGAFNIAVFWAFLFIAAYRLPGGVAATLGAVQPLFVLFLSSLWLSARWSVAAITASVMGLIGVALLVLKGNAAFDTAGVIAALAGALSMATGTVLTRKWQFPVPLLTFTAWQLTAGGLLLVPMALVLEPALPPFSATNLIGLAYLSLIGAAATFALWFRGIALLSPASASFLGFLSPATAVLLGWLILGETLTSLQVAGLAVTLLGIALGQWSQRHPAPSPTLKRKTA